MFEAIKKLFTPKRQEKKISTKRAYVLKKEHGTDISYENEVKKINKEKETKDTKSTLTFGV